MTGKAKAHYYTEEEEELAHAPAEEPAQEQNPENPIGSARGSCVVSTGVSGRRRCEDNEDQEKKELGERTGGVQKGNEAQMVEAVIETEEECKEERIADRIPLRQRPTIPTHIASGVMTMIDSVPPMLKPFSHKYVTSSQHVQDGLLPVHPLVLEVPAILRASILTMASMSHETVREASAERCPSH